MNTNGSFICACDDGFVLQSDRRSCKIVSKYQSIRVSLEIKLLCASDEAGIRLITVSGSRMGWVSPTSQTYGQVNLGPNMRYITAFDIDNRTNTYFWSDLAANTIYSRTGRASNNTKVNRLIRKMNFQKNE